MPDDRNALSSATESPRWQFSLRELMFLTVVVAMHLAALVTIYNYGNREESNTAFRGGTAGGVGGIIGITITGMIGRYRAGPSLADFRKITSRRRRHLATLVFPALALFIHAVFDQWLEMTILDFVNVGLVTGVILSAIDSISICIVRSIRLSRSGMLDRGLYFVSWSSLLHQPWTWSVTNQITIGRGWRSWTFVVPSDQRDAVDALLKAKLGRDAAG